MKLKVNARKLATWIGIALSSATLIFSWAVSSAPGGSPDEPAHFVSIYCFSEKYKDSCQEQGAEVYDLSPVKNVSACYLYQRDRGAECEVRSFFERLSLGSNAVFNSFTENYYYKTLALLASDYYVISLILMRMFNGIIFLCIILFSYFLFPKHLRDYYLFSTLVLSIPLGIYLVTSINTSAWLIIGIIGLWSSSYSLLYDLNQLKLNFRIFFSRAFLLIISFLIATSSRFDGIYFAVITIFTISLLFVLKNILNFLKQYLPIKLINSTLFILVFIVTSLSILFFQDRAKVAGSNESLLAADRVFDNFSRLPHLLLGPFGTWGLGWLDVWLSPVTYFFVAITVLGIAFVSIKNLDLPYFAAILVLALSVVLLPLIVLQSSGYLVGEWVQPRYVLPLYFPLFGLMFIALILNKAPLTNIQSATALILIAVAHSFALFANLERYIRGQNTVSLNLNTNLVWWWDSFSSPNLIWIIGSLAFSVISMFLYQRLKNKSIVGPEGLEPPTPAL